MANKVSFISATNSTRPGLHNGDLIIIRNKHFLVASVVYPDNVKVSAADKKKLCSLVSLHSGNKVFSAGIDRLIDMKTFVSKINTILGSIREGSKAHRNNYEYSDITAKSVRILSRNSYDLIIKKL